MKKSTVWLLVILFLILVGALGYVLYTNRASADVLPGQKFTYRVTKDCPANQSAEGWTVVSGNTYKAKVGEKFCFSVEWPKVSDVSTISSPAVGYQNPISANPFSYITRGSGDTGFWFEVQPLNVGRGTFLFTYGTRGSYFMINVVNPTASPTATSTGTMTPTPTPTVVGENKPSFDVTYSNGTTEKLSGIGAETNKITVKKGDKFYITAKWPQYVVATSLGYSSYCVNAPTTCRGGDYLALRQNLGGDSTLGLEAVATQVGGIVVRFTNGVTSDVNAITVTITE